MPTKRLRRSGTGYAVALLGVTVVTAVVTPLHTVISATTAALAYLLVVLFVATVWSSRPALVASTLGTLCLNFFFLPPVYSFVVADPQDWVALAVFFITAVTAGELSNLARKQSATVETQMEEIRDLYDHAPCGYHSLNPEGVIVRINDTELNWLGYAREEVIGKMTFAQLLAPGSVGAFAAEFPQLKSHGSARDFEFDLVRHNGTILPVLVSATSITDASGKYLMSRSIVYDMTERKRAEDAVLRVNRAHRALSSCNQALVRATDEVELIQQICRIIVDDAGYRLCWVGYAEQDVARTVRPIAQAGFEEGYLDVVNVTWADAERGRGPTGTCIRTGQIQLVKDIAADPRMAPWREDACRRGYASSIAIPLKAEGDVLGALTIYSADVGAFGSEEVDLLTELAGDLGYGVMSLRTQTERKLAAVEAVAREHEVAIGLKIQQMLLLDEPPRDIVGLRVAAMSIPSDRIGGDFYQFFTHGTESVDIIVADVMGKGVPAALLGAATKSEITEALCRLIAQRPAGELPEPKEVVTLAHADMGQSLIELESFVTLCYARVDLARGHLDFVDCGHTGVIHFHDGRCEMIHGDNLPLGIRNGEIFAQITVPFAAGDIFVFFSDGITEAPDAGGGRFGADRLMDCVRTNAGLEPDALVRAVRAAVAAFTNSEHVTDDLTCVAVAIGERRPPLTHAELHIGSDLKQLGKVREFVRGFCGGLSGARLPDKRVEELALAVNEAVSNVMKHAYHGRADQQLQLEADASPEGVTVRLHHFGDAFDPSAVIPPSFDGSRDSGFGVYLITRSVDQVRYYRDKDGRNCIALLKLCTS